MALSLMREMVTLESIKGVPIDPYWYRSRIGSPVRKVDCECFCHISTSGFREMGHSQCFSSIMHCIDPQ